jgi:hypothetical protein
MKTYPAHAAQNYKPEYTSYQSAHSSITTDISYTAMNTT